MRLHITLLQTSRTLIIYHQSFSVCRNNNILTSRKQSSSGRMIYRRTMMMMMMIIRNMTYLDNREKDETILSNLLFKRKVIVIQINFSFSSFSYLTLHFTDISFATIFDDKQVYTLTLTTMLDIYLAK